MAVALASSMVGVDKVVTAASGQVAVLGIEEDAFLSRYTPSSTEGR